MTKYLLTVFVILSFTQMMNAQIYPDEIRGWKRIDSTTVFESGLKNDVGAADIAFEYGFKRMYRAHYQHNDERITVDAYEFSSTIGAHGFLSTHCGEKDFYGMMGNASLASDTSAEFAIGSYCVQFKCDSVGRSKNVNVSFIYGVFDIIAKISDNELVRTPLPIEERKVGSERYYVALHSWSKLATPSLKPLLPLLENTHAFIAQYMKERLKIVRTLVSFIETDSVIRQNILQSFKEFFTKQSSIVTKQKKIEEYQWNNMKYYLVDSQKGIFLVVADQDDPGATGWLHDIFD